MSSVHRGKLNRASWPKMENAMSKEADALLGELIAFGIDAAGLHCRQPEPKPDEPYPGEPKPGEPRPRPHPRDDELF